MIVFREKKFLLFLIVVEYRWVFFSELENMYLIYDCLFWWVIYIDSIIMLKVFEF